MFWCFSRLCINRHVDDITSNALKCDVNVFRRWIVFWSNVGISSGVEKFCGTNTPSMSRKIICIGCAQFHLILNERCYKYITKIKTTEVYQSVKKTQPGLSCDCELFIAMILGMQ